MTAESEIDPDTEDALHPLAFENDKPAPKRGRATDDDKRRAYLLWGGSEGQKTIREIQQILLSEGRPCRSTQTVFAWIEQVREHRAGEIATTTGPGHVRERLASILWEVLDDVLAEFEPGKLEEKDKLAGILSTSKQLATLTGANAPAKVQGEFSGMLQLGGDLPQRLLNEVKGTQPQAMGEDVQHDYWRSRKLGPYAENGSTNGDGPAA